ncbi:MAG: hypothetical protein SGJ10_02425 [Bacteroidota bacterium]|nr:hypothetical protein [Bacteroidota bacterium]
MRINKKSRHLQDWITQVWVKLTGRRFDPANDAWLIGPIGDTDIIKDKFIYTLAKNEKLEVRQNLPQAGLLESFDDLELSTAEQNLLNPKVKAFYEKTSNYNMEIWSEWCGFFKPFGWLLSIVFSKRLQQLNLPLNSIQAAKGINSNIIKLVNPITKKTKWTIWYRILKSTNDVIYSGVYTTSDVPNYSGKFLKVIFPLPNGNATVIMRKEILVDGSLKLCSDGHKFGDNGFYFTLTNHKGKYWARFVKSMHEWITVYVDEENILRADHRLKFYGLPFLNLHYKMTEKLY